jgi:4-hydroxybutyryl-CoA dehydratase/vinylacetyl-CoA-Delta-isomerase
MIPGEKAPGGRTMAIRTAQEYLADVSRLKPRVFVGGEAVEDLRSHPVTRSVVETTARVYELTSDPRFETTLTARSHLTGEPVSRNNHACRSTDDLEKRMEMTLQIAQEIGTCNYRCVGCDAISALSCTTFEMDRQLNTTYHARFNRYLERAQGLDLALSAAMTDPKGDRTKRPSEQDDPDMYLRVVEKNSDGIVVRGAKLNQSGAIAVNETMVLPGRAMGEKDREYALAFAVPNGSPGMTYIAQFTPFTAERLLARDLFELGNPRYGVRETSMVVFDDVFVPWENVFMCGEPAYAGKMVARFAKMHRMTCGGGCKAGFADLVIGGAQTVAEYLGLENVGHVQEKIIDMLKIRETVYACAVAAALRGKEEVPGSGFYFPDDMFGNIAKLNVAHGFWDLMELAGDIAGGITVTMPSERELRNPETQAYIRKYLKAKVPAEQRMRMTKFLQNWTAGLHGVGTWHGAGSTVTQRIAIARLADLEAKKRMAQRLAGLHEDPTG